MRFYSEEQISQNQAKTPEGFLVCHDAAIARIGDQLYGPGETDIEIGPDGYARVARDEEEVFRPQTIASFEGKPVVIEHPYGDVTPTNVADLAVGHMQNVRRGTGIANHLLLADLFITRQDAIELLESNPRHELSCGYDAQYEQVAPGRGRQRNIIGNHVALVSHGRCGPICSTKDHNTVDLAPCLKNPVTIRPGSEQLLPTHDEVTMKKNWFDKLRDAFKSNDYKAVKDALEEGEGVMKLTGDPEDNETHTHIHLHTGAPKITEAEGGLPNTGEEKVTNAADDSGGEAGASFGGRTFFTDAALSEEFKKIHGAVDSMKETMDKIAAKFADAFPENMQGDPEGAEGSSDPRIEGEDPDREVEGQLEEEAPLGTGDKARKARDSAFLDESFTKTLAMAEILSPGIKRPTFDSAADPKVTYGSICALRRAALKDAMRTTDGAAIVEKIAGKQPDVDKMLCRDVAPLFRGAAAMKAEKNNEQSRLTNDGVFGKDTNYGQPKVKGPKSIAEVNRINADFNIQHNSVK